MSDLHGRLHVYTHRARYPKYFSLSFLWCFAQISNRYSMNCSTWILYDSSIANIQPKIQLKESRVFVERFVQFQTNLIHLWRRWLRTSDLSISRVYMWFGIGPVLTEWTSSIFMTRPSILTPRHKDSCLVNRAGEEGLVDKQRGCHRDGEVNIVLITTGVFMV